MTTDTDTPLVVQASNPEPSGLNRFIRFLGRLVLAFLKLIPVFIIIAALAAAAWLGFQETLGYQNPYGFADDRATDPDLFGQIPLRGQFHAWFELPVDDELLNLGDYPVSQANFIT